MQLYASNLVTFHLFFVKNHKIHKLVKELKAAAVEINQAGTIKITKAEDIAHKYPQLEYHALCTFFNKKDIDFPAWINLTGYEADLISKTLMEILNNEMLNKKMPYEDCFSRYRKLVEYFTMEVGEIERGIYVLKQ